jgi:hypothetical protein
MTYALNYTHMKIFIFLYWQFSRRYSLYILVKISLQQVPVIKFEYVFLAWILFTYIDWYSETTPRNMAAGGTSKYSYWRAKSGVLAVLLNMALKY